jgi:hypothetical protein
MPATATPVRLPTPEQMKAYADELPEIYRKIVHGLAAVQPDRVIGQSVFLYDLLSALAEAPAPHYPAVVYYRAIEHLRDSGFLAGEPESRALQPTDLGEELIAAVTGKRAEPLLVPALPKPNW